MGRVKIPMKKKMEKIIKDAQMKSTEELSTIVSDAHDLPTSRTSRLNDEEVSSSLSTADERERLPDEEFQTSTVDDGLVEVYVSSESEVDLFKKKTEKAENIVKKRLFKEEPPEQQSNSSETPADIARANRQHRRRQRSTARSRDLGSAHFPGLPEFSPQAMRSFYETKLPLVPPVRFDYTRAPPCRILSPPAIRFPTEPIPIFSKENSPPLHPDPASDRDLQAASRPYLPPEQSTFIRNTKPRNGDENEEMSSESSSPKKLDG